jgi:hypothetical protein
MIQNSLEKLHPQIYVYRGVLKESAQIIKDLDATADWETWWVFGKMAHMEGLQDTRWEEFPEVEEWESHLAATKEKEYKSNSTSIIEKYFYEATKFYVEDQGLDFDNWIHQKPSVSKYESGGGVTEDLTMHYHTDYQREKAEARGNKYRITCTMYLNDDYEGGSLTFKIREDINGNPNNDIVIDYKPTAGDILVFPSGEPFYHGVKKLVSGDRYIVRTFWQEHFPGTPAWLAGELEYGEEAWNELEIIREKKFREESGTIY